LSLDKGVIEDEAPIRLDFDGLEGLKTFNDSVKDLRPFVVAI